MAKATNLELYEGEFNGHFQKLWVVTSENGNFFRVEPHCMSFKTLPSGKTVPDFKESKLEHILNPTHYQITEEMRKVKEINPRTGEEKKFGIKKDQNRSKNNGISM